MGFVASSDLFIRFALWSGLGALALTLLMLGYIAVTRYLMHRREQRYDHFLALWRPLMVACLVEPVNNPPPLPRSDLIFFLNLWNHLQESLRGEAKERLNSLALSVGIDKAVLDMLRQRDNARRLLGVVTLGQLRQKSAWPVLQKFLGSGEPLISLAAARAMVQIDPVAAVDELLPSIVLHRDWPSSKVLTILREAGASVVSGPLAEAIRLAQPDGIPYLTGFIAAANPAVIMPVLRNILVKTDDPTVITACLKQMSDPQDLDLIRHYLAHPEWSVRVQAVSALGRIGVEDDRQRLIVALADEQWWVRYRAAQALSRLPFVDIDELRRIQAQLDDRYARDMLTQIISERQLP